METQPAPQGPEINTHGATVEFGRYKGIRVTRMSLGFLRWAVAKNIQRPTVTQSGTFPMCQVAAAEIRRRGERLVDIEVSSHAIDRLSFVLPLYLRSRLEGEGLYSWAQRQGLVAWGKRCPERRRKNGSGSEFASVRVNHLELVWVFEDAAIPVVKTVCDPEGGCDVRPKDHAS